jgi:subtilisin
MKKIALAVAAALPLATMAQPAPTSHIVMLKPGTPAVVDVAAEISRSSGGRIGYVYENVLQGFSITVPAAAVAAIQRNPNVLSIEPDLAVTTFAQVVPTGVRRSMADYGKLSINSTDDYRVDADVAVLDTGIDVDHPDLNVVGGVNCLYTTGGPPARRTAYCENSETGDDDQYHGTHVAGTIAALDNGYGVAGVAPGARLWAVKVLDSQGSGSLSGIIAGIDWVVTQGNIEVINMSLGGSGSSDAMNKAVANAVKNNVTVVVAAGNSNADAAGFTPANAPDAITVSALADFDGLPGAKSNPTCRTDQDDTNANFSNWGTTVDIAAPGVCILSTIPVERGSYGTISGTSMAAPHVAGAAAILASNGHKPPAIRTMLLSSGNYGWTDNSGDGVKEPLLDIRNFTPTFVAADGGDGGSDSGGDSGGDEPNNAASISLAASGYKQRGFQKTDLTWGGATTDMVSIHRDGVIIVTTANNGAYTDNINQKGSGSYNYSVCEAGTDICSATVVVTF